MKVNLSDHAELPEQKAILDELPVLIFLAREGKVIFANAAVRSRLGEDVSSAWTLCEVEALLPGVLADEEAVVDQLRPFRATLIARDGRPVFIEGSLLLQDSGKRSVVIIAHETVPSQRLAEGALDCLPDAVVILQKNRVLYLNPAFTQLFGYLSDELVGENLDDFIVPESRRDECDGLQQNIEKNGYSLVETVRQNKKGYTFDTAVASAHLMVNGVCLGTVCCFRDIAARKQVEARLQHDAMHDGLTGLPNRTLFLDRLKLALNRRSRRRDLGCGVLFIDLDRFKEINDTLGHTVGDTVLKAMAERLGTVLRPQDTAARFGGDEFAVLVDSIASIEDLDQVAGRILQELLQPMEIQGHEVQSGASIGVALAGPDHTAPELIIRDADYAMYRAKQNGGGRCEIFDKTLCQQVSHHQDREKELRTALDTRAFEIWYEPIFRMQSRKLEGFESRLRWRRPDQSICDFEDLLLVAEETGLSISIGRDLAESVCRRMRGWTNSPPLSDLSLTMNLTHRQFFHPDFLVWMKRTLALTGVNPELILCEISENVLKENPESSVTVLKRMVDCGMRVAIDDFGAAMAPLSYLVNMPIHVLKLHPKLTASAVSGGRQYAVLDSLIHLGLNLGVQVVAQGIENQKQFETLVRMGCEMGQGVFFSPILDTEKAQQLAESGFQV